MGKAEIDRLRKFINTALDMDAVKGSPELVKVIAEASSIADAFEKDDNEQSSRYSSLQKDYIELVKSYGLGDKRDTSNEGSKQENKSLEELFEEAESKRQDKK